MKGEEKDYCYYYINDLISVTGHMLSPSVPVETEI